MNKVSMISAAKPNLLQQTGSAMSVGSVALLFKQLSILEELQSIEKPFHCMENFNENLDHAAKLDLSCRETLPVCRKYYLFKITISSTESISSK